jgi:hypothetical protein
MPHRTHAILIIALVASSVQSPALPSTLTGGSGTPMVSPRKASPQSVLAQTGVIAFRDDCAGLLYAMRGDGSGRVALPLPPLPMPTDRYLQPLVLDVTTSGPITVIYYVGISRIEVIDGQNVLTLLDHGLFAVQVDDVGGVLAPEPPVRLSLPESLPAFSGIDPNTARNGSFSPIALGDRLALVAVDPSVSVLMTFKVDRDSTTSKITGLSDLVVVGDLRSLGTPDPNFPPGAGLPVDIDYSPDGTSIVASIWSDLWMISLGDGNTYPSAERLTDTDGFAEWNPSFSPDGSHIAYTGGVISSSGGVSSRDADIYTIMPATRAVMRVTTHSNKGSAARLRNNPRWSPDSEWIGFTAYTSGTPRHSPCSGLVNSEIFLIKADGSTTATQITDTNGTSVEVWPKWGF